MTEQEILAEAERRYLFDAEFHARCEVVGNLLEPIGNDRGAVVHAAAVALIVATLDPLTGRPT